MGAPGPALAGDIPLRYVHPDRHLLLGEAAGLGAASVFFDDMTAGLLASSSSARPVPIDELPAMSDADRPAGLLLHTGRCGSTLVQRMLDRSPDAAVVGEPAALRAPHRLLRIGAMGDDDFATVWPSIAAAFGRAAAGAGRRCVVRLSSWQAADAGRLAALLPGVPVVFLHRSVHEVVASNVAAPPRYLINIVTEASTTGLPSDHWLPVSGLRPTATAAEVYATDWATDVAGALDLPPDRVLLVSYDEVVAEPAATMARITAHLGLAAVPPEDLRAEAGTYSKAPGRDEVFDPHDRHHRPPLSPRTRALVDAIAAPTEARLAARLG